jgi:RNA-directed DNA polymerase
LCQHPTEIRELTGRRWLPLRPEAIAQEVNKFLRGWAAYFRYGHSARRFSKIRQYGRMRLAMFVRKKHRRSRGFRWRALVFLLTRGTGVAQPPGKPAEHEGGWSWS